jgi:hypothetical protein
VKTEPNTAATAAEQLPPAQADPKPATGQQTLRLSAASTDRELDEALERWDDEGGACP